MVRGRDACWEHCVMVDSTHQKVRCNYCQQEFSGGVYRMKFHLAWIKNKDVVPCTEVPSDVRDMIQNLVRSPKKQKTTKKPKTENDDHSGQHSESANGDFQPLVDANDNHGGIFPSFSSHDPAPSHQSQEDSELERKREQLNRSLTQFLAYYSIPLNAVNSIHFQNMITEIANYGPCYPTAKMLRTTLFDDAKAEIMEKHTRLREEWKETGCTIMLDCWSNGRSRSILVLSVASPKGIIFLKSVKASGQKNNPQYLFEILNSVIMEIGVESIVQVITDGSATSACLGGLLSEKYPSLFCYPSVSHCVDKMLEDICKLGWVSAVIQEAKIVRDYICDHDWVWDMMSRFTNDADVNRPDAPGNAKELLPLRSLVNHADDLKHMFSHADWLSSTYHKTPLGQAVESSMCSDEFWKSAQELVSVTEPLLKLLRIVDVDMPAMGYIYEGMERAKAHIKSYYNDCEEKYILISEIINRWNSQLSQLLAAAAFLNPSIFYNANYNLDPNIRNDFYATMLKMLPEEKDKIELTKDQPVYINAQGAVGSPFAIMGRTLNSPAEWWTAFGYEIPAFQRAATGILSQRCSSLQCAWNWTNFQNLHFPKHIYVNRRKFRDYVFVHYNLRLEDLHVRSTRKYGPIVFDEIDVDADWPTESEFECTPPALSSCWLEGLI